MRIDRRLNLVVPVEQDDGTTVHVHSAPISREVFERHFMLLGRTFAAIYTEGLGWSAGPRVAGLLLRRLAKDADDMRAEALTPRPPPGTPGPQQVEAEQLVDEVRRLSSVLGLPGGALPLDQAIAQGIISPEDASEVENAIMFFTVASSVHKRIDQRGILDGASKMWGAQLTSLNSTEFAATLPTSTPAGSTGASPA